MKLCRLITLDIMGTLLDVCAPVGVQYSQIGAKFGLKINPQLLTNNFGKVWKDMKKRHPNYGLHTGLGWENWWKQLVQETFINSSTTTLDTVILNEISHQLVSIYNYPEQWKFCDGAVEFIEYLSCKEIPLVILSNFDDRLDVILENMGIRNYFKHVVTSYNAGFEKPDERIFLAVEKIVKSIDGLHDIKKSEILHIGDTPELDFIPAVNVGWKACLISHKPLSEIHKQYPMIDEKYIFKNLHDLRMDFL